VKQRSRDSQARQRSADIIWYFLRRYPRRSILIVVLLFLSGLAEGLGVASLLPLLELAIGDPTSEPSGVSRFAADMLGRVGLQPTLGVLLVGLVVAMTAKGAFMWLSVRQQGYAVAGIATDLRLMLIRAFLKARWPYFIRQRAGHMANAIGTEAQRASTAYSAVCTLLAQVVQVLVYATVAFLVSAMVAIAALVAGSLLVLLLSRLVQVARDAGRRQTVLVKSLSARLIDALYGIKPIKAMARESHLQPLLEAETRELNEAQRRQVLASGVLSSFKEPLLIVVIALGLFAVMTRGAVSFESLLIMVFLFHRLVGRVQSLQSTFQDLVKSESAFWSLLDSVQVAEDNAETVTGRVRPPELDTEIALVDVSFSYGDAPVLHGGSLTIPAGQLTAIIGPSGAGKTTIADLLLGLYQPDTGSITVDGIPLADIDLAAWRRQIGYVPQEMLLFHDTIRRNVTLGDESIPDEDVVTALQDAGAWDFVEPLDHGMDTLIGEHGARLSGGQRQRIALARALVGKPRLLILDEVTTALDPRTEAAICSTLRTLAGRDVTIVSISHQPAMRRIADVVYRVEHGTIDQVPAERALAEARQPTA
jgi:ATP-binding cassette, subfamily C, bacterial